MTQSLQDAKLALLNSLAKDYPFGIPRRIETKLQTKPASKKLALIYVPSGSDDADKALLDGAITKGMKLTLSDVLVRSITPDSETNLQSIEASIVLILGNEAWSTLSGKIPAELPGQWCSHQGKYLMLSRSLTSILNDQESKRAFWSDLKLAMQKLSVGTL